MAQEMKSPRYFWTSRMLLRSGIKKIYSWKYCLFRLEMLEHLYSKFEKSVFARLCQAISVKAHEGDPLSIWVFEEAGAQLAKHLIAVSQRAHSVSGLFLFVPIFIAFNNETIPSAEIVHNWYNWCVHSELSIYII